MISFENFIPEEGMPIYLQIVRHIKRGIVSGAVVHGDEVPSRRVLSALLGVNPNTVARAYSLLEEEGIVVSLPKKGIYVTDGAREVYAKEKELLIALREKGISKEALLKWIEEVYTDHD